MLMWIVPWMRAVLCTESFSLVSGRRKQTKSRDLLAVHVDDADRLSAVDGEGRAAPGLEHLVAKDRTGRVGRRACGLLWSVSSSRVSRVQGSPARPAQQRGLRPPHWDRTAGRAVAISTPSRRSAEVLGSS